MGKKLLASGVLGPGESHFWFSNKKAHDRARTYTAVPVWYGGKVYVNGILVGEVVPDEDQQVMVGEVYHLLFSGFHAPADWNNLQANIEVRNRRTDTSCHYNLYEWES